MAKFNRVHAICAIIRRQPCQFCPSWEDSDYGKVKRGCRWAAEEAYNIARTGNPWGKSNNGKGVKAWRKRHNKLFDPLPEGNNDRS